MQDLHLVGYTTDRRHLIFSARRGSKSGGFVVPVDDELVAAVRELASAEPEDEAGPDEAAGPGDDESRTPSHPPRVDARLSVREVQARLRAGEDVAQVAADAGVDPDWVERFAPPVRAEQRQMVDRALRMRMQRPRGGASAVPLRRAAAAAMAERGVPFTAESFDAAWTARLVGADRWVVELHYHHRGRMRTASWAVDTDADVLTAVERTATQIGFVAEGDTVPPESETIRSALTITTSSPSFEPEAEEATSSDAPERAGRRSTGRRSPASKRATRGGDAARPAKKPTAKQKAAAKNAGTRRTAAKKSSATKRSATKRSAANKAAAKKTAATQKRAATKKATAKKPAGKTSARTTGGPNKPAKKAATKSAAAKRAATKKAAAKQAGAKRVATKKAATRKAGDEALDERPMVRLREPDRLPEAPAAGGSAADAVEDRSGGGSDDRGEPAGVVPEEAPPVRPAPSERIAAQRARAVERSAPTVQFRAGSATPAREAGANGAADPRQVRISSDPMRSTAAAPPSTNGRDADATRRRRTRQLRAR